MSGGDSMSLNPTRISVSSPDDVFWGHHSMALCRVFHQFSRFPAAYEVCGPPNGCPLVRLVSWGHMHARPRQISPQIVLWPTEHVYCPCAALLMGNLKKVYNDPPGASSVSPIEWPMSDDASLRVLGPSLSGGASELFSIRPKHLCIGSALMPKTRHM